MKDLLQFILSKITGGKDFEIHESTDAGVTNFQVLAPKELMGILIGKGGKTVRTIRSLLKIRATLEKRAVNLEIAER